jgi:hypothetical protein
MSVAYIICGNSIMFPLNKDCLTQPDAHSLVPYEPRLGPRPSLSRPEALLTAQASLFESLGPSKPEDISGLENPDVRPSVRLSASYK